MNSRMTAKERGLIKGALRRAFSRSELRQAVLNSVDIIHSDPSRPRVKKWSRCPVCTNPRPKYTLVVDHIQPVIPTDKALEEMTWDEVIDRMWCEIENLQPICESCHDEKTAKEREARKFSKKGKSNVGRKAVKRPSKASSKRNSARSTKRAAVRSTTKARRR